MHHYSDLKVMYSAAGWYIGTTYHGRGEYMAAGSRDSQYFPTEEAAAEALASGEWEQRMYP